MSLPISESHIYFDEEDADHTWHAQIPNIIDEMGLDPYEFRIYCHIKKMVGVRGERPCFESLETMAKQTNMCLNKCRSCIKNLESGKNKFNLPLIKIITRKNEKGGDTSSVYRILNIWKFNGDFYREKQIKEKNKDSTRWRGGLHQMEGGTPPDGAYKEQDKKETDEKMVGLVGAQGAGDKTEEKKMIFRTKKSSGVIAIALDKIMERLHNLSCSDVEIEYALKYVKESNPYMNEPINYLNKIIINKRKEDVIANAKSRKSNSGNDYQNIVQAGHARMLAKASAQHTS